MITNAPLPYITPYHLGIVSYTISEFDIQSMIVACRAVLLPWYWMYMHNTCDMCIAWCFPTCPQASAYIRQSICDHIHVSTIKHHIVINFKKIKNLKKN